MEVNESVIYGCVYRNIRNYMNDHKHSRATLQFHGISGAIAEISMLILLTKVGHKMVVMDQKLDANCRKTKKKQQPFWLWHRIVFPKHARPKCLLGLYFSGLFDNIVLFGLMQMHFSFSFQMSRRFDHKWSAP